MFCHILKMCMELKFKAMIYNISSAMNNIFTDSRLRIFIITLSKAFNSTEKIEFQYLNSIKFYRMVLNYLAHWSLHVNRQNFWVK